MRVGDPIFSPKGKPGVVADKDKETEQLSVDGKHEVVKDQFRHGYLYGLDKKREDFNEIMDEISELESPKEKAQVLQEKIQEMEENKSKDSVRLIRYLKSELVHLMSTYNLSPRSYVVPPHKASIMRK